MYINMHSHPVAFKGRLLPASKRQLLNLFALTSILVIAICLLPMSALGQEHVLDFESLSAGDRIDEVSSNLGYSGVTVYGAHDSCPLRNTAITYDSSCPGGCTGGDDDLGTPNTTFGGPGVGVGGEDGSDYANNNALGNLMIVHQFCNDLDNLPVANPRNYGGASTITFTFPTKVTVTGMTVIDVEPQEKFGIEYFDQNDVSLGKQYSPATEDNGVKVITAEASVGGFPYGVRKIVINREGSGALDNISFIPELADLSLTAEVNNPAPTVDEEVSFSFVLKNDGINDASDVTVEFYVPYGLTYEGASTTAGDGVSFKWPVGDIAVGDSMFYSFPAVATMDTTMEAVGEVMTSSHIDPDSTPGNGLASEDDQASAVVTPGESSSGGDGGIESDGNMATLLAKRLFHRRVDAQEARALRQAPEAILFSSNPGTTISKGGQGAGDLRAAIPGEGPLGTIAYEVTPDDLVDFTNATSVLSVDYNQINGRRLGAIFSAMSPSGFLYDHSKTSCDRLGGGHLRDVRIVEVAGKPFVLSTLVHADNSVDYSISFVAYRSGNTYTIDSRFASEEYNVPASADEVLNIQVWGVAPTFTQAVTQELLDGLAEQGALEFANGATAAPDVFVVDGKYEQGTVSLRLLNKTGASEVTIRGSVARTEAEAEAEIRTAFSETVTLSPITEEDPYSLVELDLGALFDVTIFVEHEPSKSIDQLYHADGAWSYSFGETTTVDEFAVLEQQNNFAADKYAVERTGVLKGDVTDWASLFKYLRPNGQPVDLSEFSYLSFMASGEGTVRLILEKAGITDWDQYGYTLTLSPEKAYYKIPFEDFKKETTHADPMTAEDVTLIAFYALGDGVEPAKFSMNIEQLTFGGAEIDGENELPLGYALDQNFPNPFNPTTQFTFTLDEPMDVKVSVYDMLGREVGVLLEGLQPGGTSTVTFDAGNLPSGLYLYRLETPRGQAVQFMSLLK